jgi:ribosome-associated protein
MLTAPAATKTGVMPAGRLTGEEGDVMILKGVNPPVPPWDGVHEPLLSGVGLGESGPEVTNGDGDDDPTLVHTPVVAGLPAWISTPEGGHLKLATTGQFILPSLDRACLAARVASENKARDIVVLDLRGITPLYDFFVLATGASRRQIHTITEEVDAALRGQGDRRLAVEGYEASTWVVQDYGDVMVHVFNPQTREYYSLEDLWADAPKIDWEHHVGADEIE